MTIRRSYRLAAEAAGLAAGRHDHGDRRHPLGEDSAELRTLIFSHHPGDSVALAYLDALGNASTVTVTLATGPAQ